jgi:hypothetical protein
LGSTAVADLELALSAYESASEPVKEK